VVAVSIHRIGSLNRLWANLTPLGDPVTRVTLDLPVERVESMADEGLRHRFASGDHRVMRELYREYGGPVFGVALRVLRNRGLAEEAVQQTFLQAWRASASFDPSRDIAPWLFTIARRVSIDLLRREQRHLTDEIGDRDVPTTGGTLEGAWAVYEVRRALDRLPEEERQVLAATHFEGLTHEQTAERLGIPLGTVKSRSHRAYRRLKELLAHKEEVTA
jgi:RNA polymerase sigma factor (sigma-70 family)